MVKNPYFHNLEPILKVRETILIDLLWVILVVKTLVVLDGSPTPAW